METYEVLEKALALIEDERNWGQGQLAQDGKFCAEGACIKAGRAKMNLDERGGVYVEPNEDYYKALEALWRFACPVYHFNDTHSHAEVCDLFRKAIRGEKRKAGVLIDTPPQSLEGCPESLKVYA